MVYTLRFFFFCTSKCSLFHNSNAFGFCIIHILYTECAKIKNNSSAKSPTFRRLMSTITDVPYRTANLQSCILYIYSTNIRTEYFKHGVYSPFFFLSSKCSLFHNSNLFGSCIIHILYTVCAKIKKIIPAPKG